MDTLLNSFAKPPQNTRVVVAMSGGVDSSVAAALLHRAGFDVVGITLQLYDHGMALKKKGACCAGQDIYDASMVAEKLGFPHYVLDYESKFKESVIDDFADSYLRGETPIPCVKCNQTVKFHDLLEAARSLDAEAMVTGHYVQRLLGPQGAELHQGVDPKKDQSYFLFATTQAQLDFLRFPLGGMTKQETRALAQQFDLPVKEKPDSQDICFVPTGGYAQLVQKLRPEALKPGNIVHINGEILGIHDGIIQFTIGQRRGIGIGGRSEADTLYVIRLDPETHEVVVGPKEALAKSRITLGRLNWLAPELTKEATEGLLSCHVKIRSSGAPLPANIQITGASAVVEFETPEFGISPGQAAVLYQGSRVLGGGWIQ